MTAAISNFENSTTKNKNLRKAIAHAIDVNKKIEIGQNYQIINQNLLGVTVRNLRFKPDIIILKSAAHINLKTIYKCPILYFIPGIYNNNSDPEILKIILWIHIRIICFIHDRDLDPQHFNLFRQTKTQFKHKKSAKN